MSNPYAPGGQDPWNQGNGQGGFPGSQQPYGPADPNAYSQGGYVDQTQQIRRTGAVRGGNTGYAGYAA